MNVSAAIANPLFLRVTLSETGATREDEIFDPSRFSRKASANNKLRFTRNALSGGLVTNSHE